MTNNPWRQRLGWLAVAISTAVAAFWAYWGILETFHEGWYYESFVANLELTLVQYLSPMLLFMGLTLVAIRAPRVGGALYVAFALFAVWFFDVAANPGLLLLLAPLVALGGLFWYGRPRPRSRAALAVVLVPLAVLVGFGVAPARRVGQRVDDGDRTARIVTGNGVTLKWAPAGPGWPPAGGSWADAQAACGLLEEDGVTTASEGRGIWRLPTVDEAVRLMTRHGVNSGGEWDSANEVATYVTPPDKESPLWDTHSQVIYWWTATEIDGDRAYIIVYDGKVWPRSKTLSAAYLGHRCVTEP